MAKKKTKSKAKKPVKTRVKLARPRAKKAKKKVKKKAKKRLSKIEILERQVRSLTKRLKKYEGRRFVGPVREGERRKKPSRTELDAKRNQLKLFFEGVKRQAEAQGVSSKYRSHENADGSIDAELRVPLEDTGDTQGTLIDIEDSGEWNTLTDYWIMIGLNAGADEVAGSPTIDKRPHRAWTNPVRGSRAGAAFFTARETVIPKLEEYGAVFTMVVIRVFWSPYNDRPARPRK